MWMLFGALAGGCVAPKLGDTAGPPGDLAAHETGGGCEAVDVRSVAFDEDVGGYTPSDVASMVVGAHSKTLTWMNGATTGLSLNISGASEAVVVDMEVPSSGGATIEIACTDVLQMATRAQIITVDGQLNFEEDLVITSSAQGSAQAAVSLDRPDILFNPASWVSEPYDSIQSALLAEWIEGALSGQIVAQTESSSGSGPDGTVSASIIEIATF